MSKEKELSPEQKRLSIKEFDLKKGLVVATFSGVMSACFSYGLAAGEPIRKLTLDRGTPTLWQGLPVLVVVLIGGFTTNFVWCLILNLRNRTGYQYFTSEVRHPFPGRNEEHIIETALEAPSEEMVERTRLRYIETVERAAPREPERAPMLRNYLLSAFAGTVWYFQFFFYTMGETQMGNYKFSSWTLHMASIIIFSTLWGIGFKEWKGAGRRATQLLALALFLLVGSTVIVGYGNYLGLKAK